MQRYQSKIDLSGVYDTFCLLNCLDQYQRKGVDAPLQKPQPLENGCDKLDLRELIDMCKAYNQAERCLSECPQSDTKQTIMDGLQYICVEKFAEFQQYTPCYNRQCQVIEEECAGTCGGLDEFQDELYSQLTDNDTDSSQEEETTDRPEPNFTALGRRKKRQTIHKLIGNSTVGEGGGTTLEPTEPTDSPIPEGVDEESARGGFMEMCKFLGCYVNCSRPIVVKECGTKAHELLDYTARMLFSIVMVPFKLTFTDANVTEMMMDGCSDVRFIPRPHNLTVDRSTSASSSTLPQSVFVYTAAVSVFFLIKNFVKSSVY